MASELRPARSAHRRAGAELPNSGGGRVRKRVLRMICALLKIAIWASAFGAPESAGAQSSPQGAPTILQPMRFVRVRSNDPACQPDCAEWISAEGRIEVGTAQSFARVIAELNGRRLPVLINSPGGSATDAIAMGRLIRAKRLAVALARTELDACAPPAKECGEARGSAVSIGAACGSACPFVLAGGIERYASPLSVIGVHQVTVTALKDAVIRHFLVRYRIVNGRKEEISRTFTGETHISTTRQAATSKIDSGIQAYFKEIGVGPQLMALIYATPATQIHWLSAQELRESNLVTIWIDRVSAVVGGGANGLAGVPVDPSSNHKALVSAQGSWRFALPVAGRTVALEATFAYRRGGGVVKTTLATRDSVSIAHADVRGRGFMLTLTPGDVSYRLLKPLTGDPTRSVIPLVQFCRLSNRGRIAIEPFDEDPSMDALEFATIADPREPPIVIDVGAVAGIGALFEEACPPSLRGAGVGS
jgi:hypothetical protein